LPTGIKIPTAGIFYKNIALSPVCFAIKIYAGKLYAMTSQASFTPACSKHGHLLMDFIIPQLGLGYLLKLRVLYILKACPSPAVRAVYAAGAEHPGQFPLAFYTNKLIKLIVHYTHSLPDKRTVH
jgi:hypothetical protein